jgi:hypothetical protein
MCPRFVALSALAPLAVACSAPVVVPGSGGDALVRDATDGASSAGLVVVERTVTAEETAHGRAVARFIKMRTGSIDDQTLRMLGATLDLPPLGTCAPATPTSAEPPSLDAATFGEEDRPRAVELLDVGAMTVEAAGVHTALEARSLPDIVDLITGVLYSTQITAKDPEGLAANGSYVIRSTGSSGGADAEHNVPAFVLSATAPGAPESLRIDGQDARSSEGVVLTAGAPVSIAWSVGDASDPDDVVYVEVVSPGLTSVETGSAPAADVRCLFADRGSATVPASTFVLGERGEPRIPRLLATEPTEMTGGTMVVHRVHRETFQVAGPTPQAPGRMAIESGVVRFDFARAVEFTRH